MDLRIVAKLVSSKIGEKPADLDEVLEALGVEMGWQEKISLLQYMEGVEAVYHAVSGRIILRKVPQRATI
ncbi:MULTISPECIES: hypothetical protein [Pyrobaculum]|uniref:Uncharacterized protein n=2 Tax=Pyrobaculum arsenaticum TaxID=121277 RepID=A4WLA5_PYRAR|nr:hypothetical protein [Pyrobaculum arsenaticum]ABP51172.1 conserved hypothetical protein [Pyrobaculum arsenaticum DSM 13514]MCY0891592.1 hypothetical protein [Pyrobaculum arsenaticum]NYR15104.1 hypothetical protein [Pyrobaculum arsenaticum]